MGCPAGALSTYWSELEACSGTGQPQWEMAPVLLFFVAASVGGYAMVARVGGAFSVGLLSLIVSMPAVISRVKKQAQR